MLCLDLEQSDSSRIYLLFPFITFMCHSLLFFLSAFYKVAACQSVMAEWDVLKLLADSQFIPP